MGMELLKQRGYLDFNRFYALLGVLLLFVLVFLAGALSVVFAVEQQQAIFEPSSRGLSWWQFLLIVFSPGGVGVAATIVFVRYQRLFSRADGEDKSKRYWFRYTLVWGAVFGVLCQAGLQGTISYLTGIPVMWELLLVAVGVTGLASMGAYELLRWRLAVKIRNGQDKYKPVYHWLSARPQGNYDQGSDNGDGPLTQFMRDDSDDPTDPRGG